jgi:cardiolipin synthase
MPGIPDKKFVYYMTRSNYEALIRDGVKIYEYAPGFMHAKNFVCDDKFAVCGSINLDYRSLSHHFECGVWMYNVDAVRDMKTDFIDSMERSDRIIEKFAKLTGLQKLIRNIMKAFFPLL